MMRKNPNNPATIMRTALVIPLSLVLIIAVVSCSGSRKAVKTQKESPPPPAEQPSEIFVVVEEMPVYPGGDEAMLKFITDNVKYPEEAKAKKIEGRVAVRFCITAEGKTDKFTVIRGVDPLLDNEAIRVLKLMGPWKPGQQGGKAVNVWYMVPVSFSLTGDAKSTRVNYFVYGSDTIYHFAKEPPQFPGGKDALSAFKSENLKFPPELINDGFTGNVVVSVLVGKDGKLSNYSISGGVSPTLDAEALRVVKMMPDWIPGQENGKPVICRQTVYFNFFPPVPEGEAPSEIFVVVEEMPAFPGGDTALMNFIYKNVQYPKMAKDQGVQGRVILRFEVTYKGGIGEVGVVKGVHPLLDAEAIRVVKLLPAWQAGKQGGKPVNVWYSLPVTFTLNGTTPPGVKPAVSDAPPPPPPPMPPPPVPAMLSGYDEPPVFPGGEKGIMKFIESTRIYPSVAKTNGIRGTVKVRLTIPVSGKPERISIISSVDPVLDAEALRIINLMPNWQPGKLQGKPVSVSYTIPIAFK